MLTLIAIMQIAKSSSEDAVFLCASPLLRDNFLEGGTH